MAHELASIRPLIYFLDFLKLFRVIHPIQFHYKYKKCLRNNTNGRINDIEKPNDAFFLFIPIIIFVGLCITIGRQLLIKLNSDFQNRIDD